MAAAGETPQKEPAVTYLWPCNARAWEIWLQLQTQWRYSTSGAPIGMDYNGVAAFLKAHVKGRAARKKIWWRLQVCEAALSSLIHESDEERS